MQSLSPPGCNVSAFICTELATGIRILQFVTLLRYLEQAGRGKEIRLGPTVNLRIAHNAARVFQLPRNLGANIGDALASAEFLQRSCLGVLGRPLRQCGLRSSPQGIRCGIGSWGGQRLSMGDYVIYAQQHLRGNPGIGTNHFSQRRAAQRRRVLGYRAPSSQQWASAKSVHGVLSFTTYRRRALSQRKVRSMARLDRRSRQPPISFSSSLSRDFVRSISPPVTVTRTTVGTPF